MPAPAERKVYELFLVAMRFKLLECNTEANASVTNKSIRDAAGAAPIIKGVMCLKKHCTNGAVSLLDSYVT